jgi:hypothetical protein
MFSQNTAKSTVPSYYMIRTNLPARKPQNQWQPVYYFAGTTQRQQRRILLTHKRREAASNAALSASTVSAIQRSDAFRALDKQKRLAAPLVGLDIARNLYSHGLVHLASPIVDELHSTRNLTSFEYASLIRSLSAEAVGRNVLQTSAQCDITLTYKLMAERQGGERAAEAQRLFEMAHTGLNAMGRSGVSAAHYNALMDVLLTCGFDEVKQVSHILYDQLGARQIAPTARTYELVIRSLVLLGNTAEAEGVLSFIRSHHPDEMTVDMMNSMILGHRETKTYDQCDSIWNELVDRRWPRANTLSAELYLRSIVDHSYTQVGSKAMSLSGRLNTVEKKKVPIVLTQMDTLGIPRSSLSPPLIDEVEDSLRKFAIHQSRFYEWGRAVKQFDFVEFRRRNGWLYDIHELSTTPHRAPQTRDPDNPQAAVGAQLTAELPQHFTAKHPWMLNAFEQELSVVENKERMEDVRSSEIYYDDVQSVHKRSATWVSEVPQTRYDQLYGMNHPDIPKIGIRRHLDVEYVNRQEVLERDAALVKRTLSGARRLRKKGDNTSTHRKAADEKE